MQDEAATPTGSYTATTNYQLATGGNHRTKNILDWQLASFLGRSQLTQLISPEPPFALPIEMQNQEPACGAHAGNYVKEGLDLMNSVTFHGSPEFLWQQIKLIDGIPPANGTDMTAIFKTMQIKGICSATLLPNDSTLPLDLYSAPTSSQDALGDALTHKTGNYAFTDCPTFQDIKTAINSFGYVILLLDVGNEMYVDAQGNGSWAETDILPLAPGRTITSGHFVCAFTYDDNYIYFYNSWSASWGRQGVGYFGENYISQVAEMGTTVNIADVQFDKPLQYGEKSAEVHQLQTYLISKGYSIPAGATGTYLDQTAAAVLQWQVANNVDTLANLQADNGHFFGEKSLAVINS